MIRVDTFSPLPAPTQEEFYIVVKGSGQKLLNECATRKIIVKFVHEYPQHGYTSATAFAEPGYLHSILTAWLAETTKPIDRQSALPGTLLQFRKSGLGC